MGSARYVAFTSVLRPEEMPGQASLFSSLEWPYVEALKNSFGVERLLWASDFTPSLDWLSFPQTLGLFGYMPFLDDADREKIEGENLLELLGEIG